MKAAILTFTDGTNIGQRLQNFALQKVISDMGYEVCTIKQGYPFNKYKKIVRNIFNWICHPKREYICAKRQEKFDSFNKKHISFYKKEMPFHGNNENFAKEIDKFIVGSDQVWNPYSPHVGDNFFLRFATREQRYTYATSFSVDNIPVEQKELFKERIEGFDTILVREDKAVDIIREISGKKAEVVLDPTLLVDVKEWNCIKKDCSIKPKKKYILSLFLGNIPSDDIKMLRQMLGLEVFSLDNVSIIGPDEFLDIIQDAELVLTDSYHITIFSVIYHIPFVNFLRSGIDIDMNSRFETLYRLLGINNRQWTYLQDHICEINNVDFDVIDEKIQCERKRSRDLLSQTLGV